MKTIARDLNIFVANLNTNKVRMIIMLVTLGMFVLGAAAPEDAGGFLH